LSPHSPGSDQIDTLLWIGSAVAAILVLAVAVALLYVVRRFRSERGAEPRQLLSGRGLQFRVGALLTLFATLLFVLGVVLTDNARERSSTGEAGLVSQKGDPLNLKIKATGQQWLWRYDYPNGAFSYYKLVVPSDTAVELELLSTDVVHTWNVSDLARKADAVPGKTNKVHFITDEEGVYEGASATLSGQAYASMKTAIEVVSPEDYEEFVETRKSEIETAEERVVEQLENGETP
jgi:cytochrome c oxidase subunit II